MFLPVIAVAFGCSPCRGIVARTVFNSEKSRIMMAKLAKRECHLYAFIYSSIIIIIDYDRFNGLDITAVAVNKTSMVRRGLSVKL
jgi:hypothetical protein